MFVGAKSWTKYTSLTNRLAEIINTRWKKSMQEFHTVLPMYVSIYLSIKFIKLWMISDQYRYMTPGKNLVLGARRFRGIGDK